MTWPTRPTTGRPTSPAGWTIRHVAHPPPVAADGHDATTFPDLVPGPNGQITYDVDNDGDGQTDSVWVDLGYPARRNAQGQLYKPLFAFMVIGLNGRIPLNTAGNLAGGGPGNGGTHAAHLGNSVSEIDPTYGLQNGFVFANRRRGGLHDPGLRDSSLPASDSQVDSGGIDVRLTQLRNLLTGTRPQTNPGVPGLSPGAPDPTGQINGDNNFVLINSIPYFMPNSIADIGDVDMNGNSPPPLLGCSASLPPWRAGGASRSRCPATRFPTPTAAAVQPGHADFQQPHPRRLLDRLTDLTTTASRATRPTTITTRSTPTRRSRLDNRLGEVGDLDFLDPAGAFLLPVERLRRYVTPGDINGTGRIVQWDGVNTTGPAPMPAATSGGVSSTPATSGRPACRDWSRPPPGTTAHTTRSPSPGRVPKPIRPPWSRTTWPNPAPTPPSNSNPLHGFEAQRFPNLNYPPASPNSFNPQRAGGVPIDLNAESEPRPTCRARSPPMMPASTAR